MNKLKKRLRFKRLKIAEQILVVLFCAVLIPMAISAFIINNINQQAMRAQLRSSAVLIANMVSEEINVFTKTSENELKQMDLILNRLSSNEEKQLFLKQILKNLPQYSDLRIVNSEREVQRIKKNNPPQTYITIAIQTSDNKYLVGIYSVDYLKNNLFNSLKDDIRQIYIIDSDQNLIAAHNYSEPAYLKTLSLLPKNLSINYPEIFGDVDNQPLVYLQKSYPEVLILVNTTEKVTRHVINDNRWKLLMSVFVASLSVFIIVGFYLYYLYINIRQLFKGIMAVSKGSYERRIRLLTNVFTPYEIIFLAFEFNKMAAQIHKSYIQLKKNNEELKQLNEFRSNLIDTVSHELRTPLTSIQGYTSRLLRQDIVIDEETKQKSLRIIKNQSERLKRMIEDLLVIPDIERDRIRVTIEPIWLSETIKTAQILVKNEENKEIINNVNEDFPLIMADKDRMEQIIVNLLENAIKYSTPDTPIIIDGVYHSEYACIYIKNECPIIDKKKLEELFEKFTRIDDKTTRTTRGTGLGLFIVKGLVEAMNGEINLYSNEEQGFCVELKLPLFKTITVKP